jgi:hypothetical protein
MSHKRNRRSRLHPPGSPPDVLRRLKKCAREHAQLILDIESCNDNNPNFRDCPLDTGADRVLLARCRAAIAQIERDGVVDLVIFRKYIDAANAAIADGED